MALSVARKNERFLKTVLPGGAAFGLLLGLWPAAFASASGAEPSDLIVGSVRDTAGDPVAGAGVRVFDVAGKPAGNDLTGIDGTFVVNAAAPAAVLELHCAYCRNLRIELRGRTNLALVVTRYAALASETPSRDDVAALPYGRIVDALALAPFVIPANDGANVSDRGLGGGRGLVVDDGVPLVDLASGTTALADFPDRYARTASIVGPERAFTYGSYAGGGIFSLDRLDGESPSGTLVAGGTQVFSLQPSFRAVFPGFAQSTDAGLLSQRADIDVRSSFAGGVLRAGAASGSQTASGQALDASRSFDLAHVSYAAASARYRTFVTFAGERVAASDGEPAPSGFGSSYLDASFRVERPGTVRLAAGALEQGETGSFPAEGDVSAQTPGSARTSTAYAEASTGDARADLHAGVAASNVAVVETLDGRCSSAVRFAVVPSIGSQIALAGGTYFRTSYSAAVRVPTLLESYASYAIPSLERSGLEEAAFGVDTENRVRAEFTAFREDTTGADRRRLDGLGASLVWQVTPLVSLRAWSLNDSVTDNSAYGFATPSRQVLWATYAGAGFRIDAIVHRDATNEAKPVSLDGDLNVPIVRDTTLHLGTDETSGVRRYFFGLLAR